MNLEQLYFITEITAAIAVIISFIYLGVQIQNTRIQNKKEMHLDMSKFRSDLTLKLASEKELSYKVITYFSKNFINGLLLGHSYCYRSFSVGTMKANV